MKQARKKLIRKVTPYAVATLVGSAVMPAAIKAAEIQRGQAGQIGGEYLIIPLLWLLVALTKTILSIFAEYILNRE